MKNRFFPLIMLLLLAAFVFSCKKDEEEKLNPKQMLTAQVWKLDKVLALGSDVTSDPRVAGYVKSFNNSTLQFKPDGTFTTTDNSSGATTTGTWELQENDTKLAINTGSESYNFTIKELTQNTLFLKTTFTVGPPLVPLELPIEVELQLVPAK